MIDLTDHAASLSRELCAFSAEQLDPHIAGWEAAGGWPAKTLMQQLAARVPALGASIRAGGARRLDAAIAIELAFARTLSLDIAASVSMQFSVVAPCVASYGAPALRREWLAGMLDGRMLVSHGLGDEADPASLPEAVADGDRLIVDGRSAQVVNAVGADAHAQLVRLHRPGEGWVFSLLLIPARAQGIEVRARGSMGYRCAPLADLRFRGTVVSHDRVVGEHGVGAAMVAGQRRLSCALSALRLAAASAEALARCKTWCKQRKTFGRAVIDNQAVQFRLAECSASAMSTLAFAHDAVAAHAAPDGRDELLAEKAKHLANRLAAEVAETVTHLHGSHGYVEGGWPARFYRDAAVAVKSDGAHARLLKRVFEAEIAKGPASHV